MRVVAVQIKEMQRAAWSAKPRRNRVDGSRHSILHMDLSTRAFPDSWLAFLKKSQHRIPDCFSKTNKLWIFKYFGHCV
jgi:hypothetical protein